jgi:uncharacterized protein (TIGR02453 family)
MTPKTFVEPEPLPPFDGFPKQGLRFLKNLKKNNTREWFNNHKADFEDLVKFPMQSLIASMRSPMSRLAPEIEVNPKTSMFRIYRDTRFSKNKAPYKTHVAAVFHPRGHWESSAGYYVHIEPGAVYAGGGIYMPDGDQLKKIRRSIADQPKEFLSIVGDSRFVRQFKSLEGEKLQRMPLGFPADHMMGEWLKYKSFYAGVEWEDAVCTTPNFITEVVRVYRGLLPLVRFLNSAL